MGGWKNLAAELAEEFAGLERAEEHWHSIGLRVAGSASDSDRVARWRAENPEAWKAIQARYRASEKGRAMRAREKAKRAAAARVRAAEAKGVLRSSARDALVLELLASGLSGKAVAVRLNMQPSAVSLIKSRAARGQKRFRERQTNTLTRRGESAKVGMSGGPVPV